MDDLIFQGINTGLTFKAADAFFSTITWLGCWQAMAVAPALLFLIDRKYGIFCAFTYGAGLAVSFALKKLCLRPRPFEVADVRLPEGRGHLPDLHHSFPSGHAVTVTLVMLFLWMRFPRWRPLYVSLILAVCYSRVHLGYHYPSDVLAGFLISLWVFTCSWWLWTRKTPRYFSRDAVSISTAAS